MEVETNTQNATNNTNDTTTKVELNSIQPVSENTTNSVTQVTNVAEIELSLEDVFVNLRLISKINQGEKLVQYDNHINIDTSYFQLVTRWFRGANRTDNIRFIQKVFSKAFEFNDKLVEDKSEEAAQTLLRLNTELKNSLDGLSNLKVTYLADKLVQSEIDVMIDNVRSKLDINSKHLNFNRSISINPVTVQTVLGEKAEKTETTNNTSNTNGKNIDKQEKQVHKKNN